MHKAKSQRAKGEIFRVMDRPIWSNGKANTTYRWAALLPPKKLFLANCVQLQIETSGFELNYPCRIIHRSMIERVAAQPVSAAISMSALL
jgi:hypothetical protein